MHLFAVEFHIVFITADWFIDLVLVVSYCFLSLCDSISILCVVCSVFLDLWLVLFLYTYCRNYLLHVCIYMSLYVCIPVYCYVGN